MTDNDKATKLLYSENRFESYLRLLKAELIDDDLSNEHMLIDIYTEDALPDDPIRKFISDLTQQQLLAFNAAVVAQNLHVPTKLEVLKAPKAATAPFIAFINATDQVSNAKKNAFRNAHQQFKIAEIKIYKQIAKTLLHATTFIDDDEFGARRALLHDMVMANKFNRTDEDHTELLNQFLAFRKLTKESVERYKIRLAMLKAQLETSESDPQPISKKLHKNVYIAGLRSDPHFDDALNKVTDIDKKTLQEIHAKMVTADGAIRKRIVQMHNPAPAGTSTVAAAVVSQTQAPPPPPSTTPSPTPRLSHNGKTDQPDCPLYVSTRRCLKGHRGCPLNHPILPKLKKKKQKFTGDPSRQVPNRVCNYILYGKVCPYGDTRFL